jgi:hypothetical protein
MKSIEAHPRARRTFMNIAGSETHTRVDVRDRRTTKGASTVDLTAFAKATADLKVGTTTALRCNRVTRALTYVRDARHFVRSADLQVSQKTRSTARI